MAAVLESIFNRELFRTITLVKADSGKKFFISSQLEASRILTSTGTQVTANDTVTLDTTVYKFVVSPSAAFDVDIGANAQGSIDNLIKAINLTGVAGTDYGTATTIHPTVDAGSGGALKMLVFAKRAGISGNAIAIAEAAVTLSWAGAATFLGGGAPTPSDGDRDLILTLPQNDVDGGNYEFVFTDDGSSSDGFRDYFTSWTISSGLTKPFQVTSNTRSGNPYNFRSLLNTKGATLEGVKLGGKNLPYPAGESIKFVSWGGVWYSTPPFGSGFYGIGEI